MESRNASGLIVAHRAAFPRDSVPNDNAPVGTVGPNVDPGVGDTHVLQPRSVGRVPPRMQPWAGWPVDWATPDWGGMASRLYAQVDTVYACLDLNSSVLSTMPPYRTRNGRVDWAPTWLSNPCAPLYDSWEEFAKQIFWSFMLGETFIYALDHDAEGRPSMMVMLEPWQVGVDIIDGIREYRINGEPVDRADVLHVRYSSWPNQPRGRGPLEAAGARLAAASALIAYASDVAINGGIPWGIITHPTRLTAEQAAGLQQQWLEGRLAAMGLPAVMSGGISVETLQLNPKDMTLQELQTFNEGRLAVLLGTPPPLVSLPAGQDSMTYQTLEGIYDFHWRSSLRPKAQRMMSALSNWALPRGSRIELNRDEYVRPPLPERADAYATLFGLVDQDGNRAITIAEIRAAERLDSTAAAMALTGAAA